MSLTNYLVLASVLFAIGATTVLLRRNAIIVFMGVELMLNATNLVLVTFARMHGDLSGQVMAFFVMVVAAAEVVVGLARPRRPRHRPVRARTRRRHRRGHGPDRRSGLDAGDLGQGRRPCHHGRGREVTQYVVLSAILFTIGCVGVLTRRNALVVFMCVELMLNASNLALVTFARVHGNLDGQVAAFFVMVVAAAEVVIGLAIIMSIFRTRRTASVDDANLLKY